MRSVINAVPALCSVILAAGLEVSAHAQGSLAPNIVMQPESQSVETGGSVAFNVQAEGSAPLRHQWRLYGTNLPGATNATLSITNARYFHGGPYTVAINNNFGAVTSVVASLTVDPDLVFRLVRLETNGAIAIDHATQTGDDRGGIAVSASNVFVTGDGSGNGPTTGRYSLDTLGNGTSLGRGYDALVSNLRSETLYSLGNGANPIQYTDSALNFTTTTSLIEINGATGQPTGQRITLSTGIPLDMNRENGVFAGYDRIVLHNATRAFNISLPSGLVTDLGPMSTFTHNNTENNWAYWGIAEYTGSAIYLVYVQNSQNIVRTRVPDRMTSTILSVTGTSWPFDMASITFSISRSRWYCHYEGTAFFRSGDEILGTAKGSYTTDAGYPSFTLEPQNQVSYPNSNVTFSAAAVGSAPLNYQWHFNGVPIEGANGTTLTLTDLRTNAAGLYRVDVSNPAGLVSSRNAVLTIYSVPQIVSQPASRGVFPGTNVLFSVSVNAAPPITYQWRRNGTPLGSPSAIPTLALTNIQPAMGGLYSVLVSNRFGTAISSNAELFVVSPQDDGSVFQITSLTTNGAKTVEAYNLLNNYGYGPFAVSSNRVFYSTFDQSARFNADDLAGGTALARFYPAYVSNLRTEVVYAPGTATAPFSSYGAATLATLWEIDGSTGVLGTRRVNLSSPIQLPAFGGGNVSFYSGYDRVVVLNGVRAYSVALPSGTVTDLGPMGFVGHGSSLSGAFWGIAEHSGGITYLVHGRDNRNVNRTRVPDGLSTNFVTFPNGLGSYFASLSASIRRGRWYYSYLVDNGTFGFFNCGIGYANATFNINSGSKADHFEWSPVGAVQVLNTPFNVTVTARNTTNATVTNYQGSVLLSGANVPGPGTVPITPTSTPNFVNGVWTGQVTVLGLPAAGATGMVLRASDTDGLTGVSRVFSVSPSNDLILRITDSADPVLPGAEVTYTLSITNTGPANATGVMLTNLLPANATLVSFTSSQGSCAPAAGAVLLCDLGTITVGTSPFVTVTVQTVAVGTLTNTASLRRGEPDPMPANNSVTEFTEARLPAISISDASLTEGNSGTNELNFSIRMSPATTGEVSVAYTTLNGTASSSTAIPDYVSASGVLVLPPGATNGSITILTRGDTLYEANETFLVSLSSPTNASLARALGTGLILNDDSPPFISISNITVNEGNSGLVNAVFQARLSTNCGLTVTMNYATFDGTATAPDDYTNVSGVVTFPANTLGLTRNFIVPIRADTNIESTEFFYVQIFSPTNGIITNEIATCTIANDDGRGILHHYAWAPVPSPQPAGAAFPVALLAQDIFNNTVTNFSGSAAISAGGGPNTDTNIFGDAQFPDNFTADYTLGYAFTPKFDLTVTHFRHYSGARISLWNNLGTLLASREVTGTDGAWTETPLDEPVVLTAGEKYILAFYTGGLDRPYYNRNDGETNFTHVAFVEGRLQAGDTFPSSITPFTGWVVDIRYQVGEGLEPVPISPATPAVFSKGAWSGSLTIGTIATNIILTASDTQGLIARSARFDTANGTQSDLEVKLAASTNAVSVGSNLTYTVTIFNRGPISASDVIASNSLPAGFSFVSASASQGTVSNSVGSVFAQLGGLSRGAQASVTIRARADATGWQTNLANVIGSRPDPVLINNHAVLATLVYRDTDGDGIWDDWEQLYGLNLSDPADAALDPDGDTHSNLDEFYAGTNPNDASSALRILGIETTPEGVRLTFRGVRGKTYRLESKEGADGAWTPVLVFKIGSSLRVSDVIELYDSRAATSETRMYRVEALLP